MPYTVLMCCLCQDLCGRDRSEVGSSVLINSVVGTKVALGDDAVITHSRLTREWTIGMNAFVSGVNGNSELTKVSIVIPS